MKRIDLPSNINVDYPVGDNMKNALYYIECAAGEFKKIVLTGTTVNLICRGSSGAILAGLLSAYLSDYNISIIHVRKEGEISHGGQVSRGYIDGGVNVIIDDFMSSGDTLRNIYESMRNKYGYLFKVDILILESGFGLGAGFEPDYLIEKR